MAVAIEVEELDTRLAQVPPGRRGHLILLERANARPAPLTRWRAEGERVLAWWGAAILSGPLWIGAITAWDWFATWLGLRG
jgi:hypothetical protein